MIETIKKYLCADLDRVEFNNLFRDWLGDISDEEHRELVNELAKLVKRVIG